MAAACGLSPEGVDFESEDGQPTHLFVLLVSPENATTPHVRLLANISRLLKEDSVRKGLLEARTPEEFLSVVQSGESAFIPQG
jgi:mannitol/fructose-specific phosphotransferase system IIA component (Ntr-type)